MVAVIVKTALEPIAGLGLLIAFNTARSALATGVGVTVDVLFPGVGSLSFPVIVAVLA